jgi:hypothetical protein
MIATSIQWLVRHDDVSILLRQLRHRPDNETSPARGQARSRCVFHLGFSGAKSFIVVVPSLFPPHSSKISRRVLDALAELVRPVGKRLDVSRLERAA